MSKSRQSISAIVFDADKLSQVAIIQELGRFGIPITAIARSSPAMGFGSRFVKQRIECPIPSHEDEYIEFAMSECSPGVVFYSNDASTENVARHQSELRARGFSVLVSAAETLDRVIQKHQLYETARECGIAVPRCRAVRDIDDFLRCIEQFSLPSILKATNLAGGVYRFVRDRGSAATTFVELSQLVGREEYRHRRTELMLQEWISQSAVTLWNFNACVKAGEIVSYSMGKRLRSDVQADGRLGSMLLYGTTAYNEPIYELNRRLLAHLKFDGIIETEWSVDSVTESQMYLYDFNPRASGNIRWAFRSGVSLAKDYYDLALGLKPSPGKMRPGVHYAKVLYKDSDWLQALVRKDIGPRKKLGILLQDMFLLLRSRRNAVDVLELSDPGPTVRAVRQLFSMLLQSIRARVRRTLHTLRLRIGFSTSSEPL